MRGAGRAWREWPLLFQPRALESGWEGYAFAGLCMVSLALIVLGDMSTGRTSSVGAFEAIPLIAAGWLLSDPLVVVVAAWAVLCRAVSTAVGTESAVTASVQIAIVPFLVLVSRTAAVAVAATRVADERELIVSRIAGIASSAASLEEILGRVLVEVSRPGVRGGAIALIDDRNCLYIAAAHGAVDPEVLQARLPVGQGVMGLAAAESRSILVHDLDAPDAPVSPTRNVGSNSAIRSVVAVPLLAAGQSIGVLEIDSAQAGRFTEADVSLLEQIAAAISGVVQRAGALKLADERLQRRVRELTILLDAARGVASSLDLRVILDTVCRSTAEIVLRAGVGGRRSSVVQVVGSTATILRDHDETGSSLAGLNFPLGDHPGVQRAAAAGRATAVEAGELRGEVRGRVDAMSLATGAYAPIRVGTELWGALSVSTRQAHEFVEEDLRLLQGLADLTGLAIANSELLQVERLRGEQLQEHAERMAALDHVKSEFLRLASHELRGPLAVLRGYVSMLSEGSLGALPEAAEQVMPIMSMKVREINLLIDQMLETARLEDSRLHLAREPMDLRSVVEEVVGSMLPLAGAKHPIQLEAPDHPVEASVDRARVVTILTNLIDNAIKYSPDGGPVEVRLGAAGGSAEVSVSDRGLGIDADDMPRLFTRFGRVVTRENSHIPGTGLGLYLARELARMHGGDITARSTPGQGSCFVLRLPLTATARSRATATA